MLVPHFKTATHFKVVCIRLRSAVILPCRPVYDGSSGVCLGSVVCDIRGDQCCGVGPLSVDPAHQGCGIGHVLMVAVMDHVKNAHNKLLTFRLTQVAVNTASFCL